MFCSNTPFTHSFAVDSQVFCAKPFGPRTAKITSGALRWSSQSNDFLPWFVQSHYLPLLRFIRTIIHVKGVLEHIAQMAHWKILGVLLKMSLNQLFGIYIYHELALKHLDSQNFLGLAMQWRKRNKWSKESRAFQVWGLDHGQIILSAKYEGCTANSSSYQRDSWWTVLIFH